MLYKFDCPIMRRYYISPLLELCSEDVARLIYDYLVVPISEDFAGNAVCALFNNDVETIWFIQKTYGKVFRFVNGLEGTYTIGDDIVNVPIQRLKDWVAQYNNNLDLDVLKHFAPLDYGGMLELFIFGGHNFLKFITEAPARFVINPSVRQRSLSSDEAIRHFVSYFIQENDSFGVETLNICVRNSAYKTPYKFNERMPEYKCDFYYTAIISPYYESMCPTILSLFPEHILSHYSRYNEEDRRQYIRSIIGNMYRENPHILFMEDRIKYILNYVYGEFENEFILAYQILHGASISPELMFRVIRCICVKQIDKYAECVAFMCCFGTNLTNLFISGEINSVVFDPKKDIDNDTFFLKISGYFKYYISVAIRLFPKKRENIEHIANKRLRKWEELLFYPDTKFKTPDWLEF